MCALVVALKAVAELALLFYVAQFGVRLLSFGRHEDNPVYRGLRFLTSPFTRLGSALAPAALAHRHAALLGMLSGLALWVAMVLAKRQLLCGLAP
jgi:hypothetical protein